MTEDDKPIELYYAIRKGEFGFLERLELKQSVDPAKWNGLQLEIDLRSRTGLSSSTLRLAFKGVQDLRIGEITGIVLYVIEITYIGDFQMQGQRFRITESEYNVISFVCDRFTVTQA